MWVMTHFCQSRHPDGRSCVLNLGHDIPHVYDSYDGLGVARGCLFAAAIYAVIGIGIFLFYIARSW